MNLHEYQAKGLFAEYGLPVSEGHAVDTADEAVAAAEKIGGAAVGQSKCMQVAAVRQGGKTC